MFEKKCSLVSKTASSAYLIYNEKVFVTMNQNGFILLPKNFFPLANNFMFMDQHLLVTLYMEYVICAMNIVIIL